MKSKKTYQNRLATEKSPYLLQHADNPVDWYPWGEEAFEKAQREDKPIFLSIGYSTCHWCHVMEHESFEDPKIAQLMNEYFVPIKVDREERPDIDNIYMTAVQAMTGRGGWPLTVFLTADKKPFFGGTYFPPQAKWGSPGIVDIMESIHHSWQNNRDQLIQSSNNLTGLIKANLPSGQNPQELTEEILKDAYARFLRSFDRDFGGFGTAPKFPTSHNLSFLLRFWHRSKEEQALNMVLITLKKMAEGGMYDHIGGGFHRYSTDQMWQIPHFEKMLYDQALIARTFLEAYQITKDEFYADIAREIFTYVLRDLRDPQGGFYSAEDADSFDPDAYQKMSVDPAMSHEKKEGAFYIWRYDELKAILEKDEFEAFRVRFDIKEGGNAHTDPHNEFTGKNIIFAKNSVDDTAKKLGVPIEETRKLLTSAKKKLFQARNQRPRPHLDDKILVDWNGLMISTLAFGARVLNEPEYLEAAEKAAQFVISNLITKKGRLLHRYRDKHAGILGTIEDYAFFVHGLWDLYEAGFNEKYLKLSFDLSKDMLDLFWDEESGGFFFTADDAEKLIFRQKELYDGAIPSGNSLAALNLTRLYHMSLKREWAQKQDKLFEFFSSDLSRAPNAYTQMLMAFDFMLGPSQEIVIAGKRNDDLTKQMVHAIYDRFIPNRVILLRPTGEEAEIIKLAEFVKDQKPLQNTTTAFLCENHVCKLPVNDLSKFETLLDQIKE